MPEHFCSPLRQLAETDDAIELVEQPSLSSPLYSAVFVLIVCPGGTGQMITSMKDGTIDVAIALTEALIAGIASRLPLLLYLALKSLNGSLS